MGVVLSPATRPAPAPLRATASAHRDSAAGSRRRRKESATAARVTSAVIALIVAGITLTGCTGGPDPLSSASPTPGVTGSAALQAADAWGQLAGRVAAAQDRRYTASYQLTASGKAPATLSVSVANDGSWEVVIPGGALGGTATVAIAHTTAGWYQCPMLPTPTCIALPGGLPVKSDPRFQHIFTDWLDVLINRQSAISVAAANPIAGSRGQCFSVEPNAAGLAAPMDAGIYCFDSDGTLTAAKIAAGSLAVGASGAPLASVTLPGPVVAGSPLGLASPPAPPPSPSASASPARTP
jgi:hypothetical protein